MESASRLHLMKFEDKGRITESREKKLEHRQVTDLFTVIVKVLIRKILMK